MYCVVGVGILICRRASASADTGGSRPVTTCDWVSSWSYQGCAFSFRSGVARNVNESCQDHPERPFLRLRVQRPGGGLPSVVAVVIEYWRLHARILRSVRVEVNGRGITFRLCCSRCTLGGRHGLGKLSQNFFAGPAVERNLRQHDTRPLRCGRCRFCGWGVSAAAYIVVSRRRAAGHSPAQRGDCQYCHQTQAHGSAPSRHLIRGKIVRVLVASLERPGASTTGQDRQHRGGACGCFLTP
jgi:hypothetical protein